MVSSSGQKLRPEVISEDVMTTWEHVRRSAAVFANVVHEVNYAHRLAAIRRLSVDSYVFRPNLAPETFEEFLSRTAGPLAHEPSARARALGRLVG
jgi:hypothetical protein